ncbi:MAG: CotH kinase family protein [Lachnospiraceae bacterium]|nr:CotH kinase family protein [Lachnospiraceae bacterium]
MLKRNRIDILIAAIIFLAGFIYVCTLVKGETHLQTSYNVHSLEFRAENNSSLPSTIRHFTLDDEIYFIVPHDMPKMSVLTIIDEETITAYDEQINIDKLESINGLPIHIIRSNFPVVYLDIDQEASGMSWEDFNIPENTKDVTCYGKMHLNPSGAPINDNDSSLNFIKEREYTDDVTISRHGTSSWTMCGKHSYNIKLNEKASLLGLEKTRSYALIANGKDKTLMRSYLANELAKKLGCDYTLDMKYVTLYVNSAYRGVYLLTEKPKKIMEESIKASNDSFAINWLTPSEGQIISFTDHGEFSEDVEMAEDNGLSALLVYPDPMTNEEVYYSEMIQNFINEIGSGDFSNIDEDSFIRYYWVQEVVKNYDAWYRSFYTVYDGKNEIWKAGTPWDFDMSMSHFGYTKVLDFSNAAGLIGSHGLYKDLYSNDKVKDKLINFYNSDVKSALDELIDEIDTTYDYIALEADIDYRYINTDRPDICTSEFEDFVFGTSYKNAVDNMRQFLIDRKNYLNTQFN